MELETQLLLLELLRSLLDIPGVAYRADLPARLDAEINRIGAMVAGEKAERP